MRCRCGETREKHIDDGFCPETGCFAFRPSATYFNCRCQIIADIDKRFPPEVLERMTQEQRVRFAERLYDEEVQHILKLYRMPVATGAIQ